METFAIDLLSSRGALLLAAMTLVPAAIVGAAVRLTKQPHAIQWSLVALLVPLPVIAAVVWPLLRTTVQLRDDGLAVDSGRYAITVPYAEIDVDRIVVGGSDAMPHLARRTNGIGLPGGALGWFRTGDRRVFAAYSGADGSVLIPTRKDYDVLVSPDDGARLAQALARRIGAGPDTAAAP